MGAALKGGPVEAQACEPFLNKPDVLLLAGVRGAGESEFTIADREALGSAAFEQGNGLQRLDGGARKDGPIYLARHV
jgi:hypothetical protein